MTTFSLLMLQKSQHFQILSPNTNTCCGVKAQSVCLPGGGGCGGFQKYSRDSVGVGGRVAEVESELNSESESGSESGRASALHVVYCVRGELKVGFGFWLWLVALLLLPATSHSLLATTMRIGTGPGESRETRIFACGGGGLAGS